MSDLEDFQREHGRQWSQITQSEAFGAAMQYLNLAKINSISTLSDSDIATNGTLILSDLRGHLNHENDLLRLSVMKDFKFPGAIPETYPSREEEAAELAAQERAQMPPAENSRPTHTTRKKKR